MALHSRRSVLAAVVLAVGLCVPLPAAVSAAPLAPAPGVGDWVGLAGRGDWSDYSTSVTFTIVSEAASVYFRSQHDGADSYMWQVNVTGPVPVLKKHVWAGGAVKSVSETPVEEVIPPGTEHSPHTLRIDAVGGTITTSLDGRPVDTTADSAYDKGTIGFRESSTEEARYRDLAVTSPSGATLFSDPLTGAQTPFTAGTTGVTGLDVANASPMLTPGNQAPRLRDEFRVDPRKRLRSAELVSSALGIYELRIDGRPVNGDLFAPGWTNYDHQTQYQTQDVTSLLGPGGNAIAAQLAPGWYAGNVGWFGTGQYGSTPALWAQLQLTYTDGSRQTVATGPSWTASTAGPVTAADNYLGESYDARREQPGWDLPGYHGQGWTAVDVLPSESAKLVPQTGPPVRVTGEVEPVRLTQPTPGTFVYDLGQEISGVDRLRVRGPAGTTITLRHAQALNPDGTLYTDNLAAGPEPYAHADQTDTITLSGKGNETFQPDFTYHGFRYVSVTGYPGTPTLADLTGVVEGTDAPVTGSFSTSDAMVNQLQSNITWSERDNLFSIPTDTDARAERLGWTGDADFFAPTAVFNRDLDGFYTKWERDIVDSQTAGGVYDNVAPTWPAVANAGYGGGWGDAGVVIPYTAWQQYGDTAIVRDNYASMSRYLAAMRSMSQNLVLPASFAPAADWMNVNQPTPGDLIATAYFAYDASLMAAMADATGHSADAAGYRALFGQIAAAWDAKYVAADGSIAGNSQTAYVLALHVGLLPQGQRTQAADRLVGLVHAADTHLTTGFVGTQWLLPVLTDTGHTDVAYALLEQDSYPSWGYEIAHGATTVWERWDSIEPDGAFNPAVNGNSFNHAVDGAVGAWMYQTIGGIAGDPGSPGYRHFTLRPQPGGGLTHAQAGLRTAHGRIGSSWQRTGGTTVFTFDVPPGTSATVELPGRPAFDVGAGHYRFTGASTAG
jgi:alpha-L-rhamnosidase